MILTYRAWNFPFKKKEQIGEDAHADSEASRRVYPAARRPQRSGGCKTHFAEVVAEFARIPKAGSEFWQIPLSRSPDDARANKPCLAPRRDSLQHPILTRRAVRHTVPCALRPAPR